MLYWVMLDAKLKMQFKEDKRGSTYFEITILKDELALRIHARLTHYTVRRRTASTARIRLHFIRYTGLKRNKLLNKSKAKHLKNELTYG